MKFHDLLWWYFTNFYVSCAGLSEAGDGEEDEGNFLLRATSVFVTLAASWSGHLCKEIHHFLGEHHVVFIDSHNHNLKRCEGGMTTSGVKKCPISCLIGSDLQKSNFRIDQLREMGDSDEMAQIRQRRMAEMQAMQVCSLKLWMSMNYIFQDSWK